VQRLEKLSPAALDILATEIKRKLAENKLADYRAYGKQAEFHRAGADMAIRERLLMAGNQLGKTFCAAFESAMHLTGLYPKEWDGAVFKEPVTGWAASETSQGTRDTVQRLLLGPPGSWGTGAIPKHLILEIKRAAHGVADAVETILVRHVSGGTSRVTMKTYDQGRARWQGETLDFVWFDEEPPEDIYVEGLTRTNATDGIVWVTFTPLKGMSNVVKRFLLDKQPGTHITKMTINDAEHYTPEQRAAIIAAYPAHERDARAQGIPTLGSGAIFPVLESQIKEPPMAIPAHWPRIAGIDFGWSHPTAGAWIAWDRDADTVHVYDCYRVSEATPAVHAATFRAKGQWIPVSWPHDGNNDTAAGENLASQYRKHGLNMLKNKASHAPAKGKPEGTGGNSVEAGLMDMLDRMQTGRLKIASHLEDLFSEIRMYHREDGKVVKIDDDIISALRYALMMLRFAVVNASEDREEVHDFTPQDAEMGY